MHQINSRTIVFMVVWLIFLANLAAITCTPRQILFKTTQSTQLTRGRTGIPDFDRYLDNLQAISVRPVQGIPGSRWFTADLMADPDWDSITQNQQRFAGIDVVQPNYLNNFHVTPNDPWYSLQQMSLVNLPHAWNYSTGSSQTIVGIVDSGILKDHPDLQGNIFYNSHEIPDNNVDDDHNGYIDDYCGWDFADAPEMSDDALGDYTGQDNDVTDENYHGTHVGGIIGAATNNGIGIAGTCWNVRILPIRAGFRTTSGTGFLQDDDAAAALIYGADMGCNVINMSWGDESYSPIIADACSYAYEKGIVLVASAGNNPGPYLSYPAKLACVIAVGAIDPYRSLAGFSSYGAELDIVAPGQDIYSTYKSEGPDMYKQMSGTSMSSPFVAGAAALLLSLQPNLTPDEVRAKLLTTTDDLGEEGFDQYYGHGLLNVQKLLESVSSPYIHVEYPPDNLGVSSNFDLLGTVSSDKFFRYSVMCALQSPSGGLAWKDISTNMPYPQYYYQPVTNGVIASFQLHDLMKEGLYIIRIQFENTDGDIYNCFRAVNLDNSPPIIRPNTFSIMKRYNGPNTRYYAGAVFNEQVRSELIVTASDLSQYRVLPAKLDSIQVWQLPANIPPGNIDIEIHATNNSNLQNAEPILYYNAADIEYDLISSYGFERREIGTPLVPLNRFYDFDANGFPEFPAMSLPTSGYGIDRFYEPVNNDLTVKQTYTSRFMPLDMGDTNNAGQELLGLNLDTAYLYETRHTGVYPDTLIWSATGISGGTFGDYNNDGIKDILLVQNLAAERVIQLYRRLDATHVSIPKITLQNKSATNLRNMFVPTVIVANLDNDSHPDILTADTDGDIMIFETTGETTYIQTWSHRLSVANAYYLTTGDFDGNGTTDFVVGGYKTDVLDPNQNFWFFEGFTSDGNNSYHSMGYFQFDNVMSQNAIQSFDFDNDLTSELIISITPYLYVVKYIGGRFIPIFQSLSSRNYQISTWHENNQAFFLANGYADDDSLASFLWSSQAQFTGPPTPANMMATPLDAGHVRIQWQDCGCEFFNVYRKEGNQPAQLLSQVFSPVFLDSTVVAGVQYYYAVSAYDPTYDPPEGILTQWLEAIPMDRPEVTNISMIGANELRVTFNQQVDSSSLIPGCYVVNHGMGIPLSVNSVLNQYGVQMRFRTVFPDSVSSYLLNLQNIYGITGVELTENLVPFNFTVDFTAPFIQKAVVKPDNRTVDIYISETVNAELAGSLSNYTLTPPENDIGNCPISVTVNDNIVSVTLRNELKYTSRLYVMVLSNIKDLQGNPINPNQSTCTFYRADITNLNKLVTFPNPVKAGRYGQVNFMNFPPDVKGNLAIYNISGDLIYQTGIGPFNPANHNITCQWILENSSGKKVSSGIYYYVIRMGDQTKKGKIAVLN